MLLLLLMMLLMLLMMLLMLTRLEVLCYIHGYCGGTIHQYNRAYKVNFISMDDDTFRDWARRLSQRMERRPIGD